MAGQSVEISSLW